jgi:phosphohistidine phosphatase
MKTLYIARHAKSSWDHSGLEDFQRPLIDKGRKGAVDVGEYLLKNNDKPALIISSHATRAFETAKIIANSVGYPEDKIIISENIYHGNLDRMANYFFDLADDVKSLMMVGHNPTFTYFANMFLDHKIEDLPTSGIVCIEFMTDKWEDVINAKRRTKFIISPKLLRKSGF